MGQPADSREVLVDGIGCQTARLQVHAVANHDNAAECQSRFRTVPSHEILNCVLIHSARTGRCKTVEHTVSSGQNLAIATLYAGSLAWLFYDPFRTASHA